MKRFAQWAGARITDWLTKDGPPPTTPLCDFNRLCYELRPGDIVLVEGRSRVSEVIKLITQSSWTHSAIYIGRLHDIRNAELKAQVRSFYRGDPDNQLLVEVLLGEGAIVVPMFRAAEKINYPILLVSKPSFFVAESVT